MTTQVRCFHEAIANIAAYNNNDFNDCQQLSQQLSQQVTELVEHPEKSAVMAAVEALNEKYSWAIKPLATLFSSVCVGNQMGVFRLCSGVWRSGKALAHSDLQLKQRITVLFLIRYFLDD